MGAGIANSSSRYPSVPSEWPPVGLIDSPATSTRGPTTSPLSMASRSAKAASPDDPTLRMVVKPAISVRPA
jgi:hypothetical protein